MSKTGRVVKLPSPQTETTHSKSILRHNLAVISDRDVLAANVLAECGTNQLEADALAQAQLDQGEIALPGLDVQR